MAHLGILSELNSVPHQGPQEAGKGRRSKEGVHCHIVLLPHSVPA
jgi:hypothetical protein